MRLDTTSNRQSVRSGPVRSGLVRSGQVRSGQVRGPVRSGPVRSGQVRSGQVRSGQVKSSQVKSSQIKPNQSVSQSINVERLGNIGFTTISLSSNAKNSLGVRYSFLCNNLL